MTQMCAATLRLGILRPAEPPVAFTWRHSTVQFNTRAFTFAIRKTCLSVHKDFLFVLRNTAWQEISLCFWTDEAPSPRGHFNSLGVIPWPLLGSELNLVRMGVEVFFVFALCTRAGI